MNLQPVDKTSISEEIVKQITSLISRGELRPGDRLPSERELSKRLGVGRMSLREALRTLSIVGLLEVRVGEGTFVSADVDRLVDTARAWAILTKPRDFKDLMEARITLETEIAALAAQRISAVQEAELEKILDQMKEVAGSDLVMFSTLDVEFHLAISRASQNTILERLLGTIRAHLHVWITRNLAIPHTSELALRDHRAIFQAIKSRNPEKARRQMQRHLTRMVAVFSSGSVRWGKINEKRKKRARKHDSIISN